LLEILLFLGISFSVDWALTVWNLAFILVATPIVRTVAKPVLPATWQWRKLEGDLRFAHSRQREFAESIAFFGGQIEEW
jgi:ABC-type uncharacterized transport system fused permease/ATPase subunit